MIFDFTDQKIKEYIKMLPAVLYEYITDFSDDRDVLQMLSVNRNYSNPKFFIKIFNRRYPLLKKFKKEDETWRHFYVSMIHYIAKLEEDYGFSYTRDKPKPPLDVYFNPQYFYFELRSFPVKPEDLKEAAGLSALELWQELNTDLIDVMMSKAPELITVYGEYQNGNPRAVLVVTNIKGGYPTEIGGLPVKVLTGSVIF